MPRIRVAVILQNNQQILLVKHRKYDTTYWLFPGGGLEFGETIEDCARREVREETGLDIEVGDLIYVSESIPSNQHRHVVNIYLEGRIISGEIVVGEDNILVGVDYVDIRKLNSLDFRPPICPEILKYLAHPEQPHQISLGNRWNS